MSLFHYIEASFMAARFSEKTNTYFNNTRREAELSIFVPLFASLFHAFVFCMYFNYQGGGALAFAISFFTTWVMVVFYALPKFIIFFALVWLLCRYFKSQEYFWAFVAANNWCYFPYMLLFSARVFLIMEFGAQAAQPAILNMITKLYLAMVVFFIAHNVLRIPQTLAWLAPMFFLLAHGIVLALTNRYGMMFVF